MSTKKSTDISLRDASLSESMVSEAVALVAEAQDRAIMSYPVDSDMIANLFAKYKGIALKAPDDHESYKKVREARLEFRALRLAVEKHHKGLKRPFLDVCSAIDAEKKRLCASISPGESYLKNQEKLYTDYQEKLESQRVDARMAQVNELTKTPLSRDAIADMSDSDFDVYLESLAVQKRQLEAEMARKAAEAEETARLRKELEELRRREAERAAPSPDTASLEKPTVAPPATGSARIPTEMLRTESVSEEDLNELFVEPAELNDDVSRPSTDEVLQKMRELAAELAPITKARLNNLITELEASLCV